MFQKYDVIKLKSYRICRNERQNVESISTLLSEIFFEYVYIHSQFTKCHCFKMKWHCSILIHYNFHWFSNTRNKNSWLIPTRIFSHSYLRAKAQIIIKTSNTKNFLNKNKRKRNLHRFNIFYFLYILFFLKKRRRKLLTS